METHHCPAAPTRIIPNLNQITVSAHQFVRAESPELVLASYDSTVRSLPEISSQGVQSNFDYKSQVASTVHLQGTLHISPLIHIRALLGSKKNGVVRS